MRTFTTTLMIFAFIVVSMITAGQARAQYSITDLGAGDIPEAINDAGQAAGYIQNPNNQNDAMFYSNGAVQDLGTFGNYSAVGSSINASGQIAITTNDSNYQNLYGYVYDATTGTSQYIRPLGPGGSVSGINNAGQVVGELLTGGSWHDFTYQNGTFTDIGSFGLSYANSAPHINNLGQIAGTAYGYPLGSAAFICNFNGTNAVNLGNFAGGQNPTTIYGLNDSGVVVGAQTSTSNSGENQAFIYQNGKMTNLNSLLPNSTLSLATGINAAGEVVGVYQPAGASSYSIFLYENGQMSDIGSELASSGWSNVFVRGINDNGQIVGDGTYNGATTGFILTPDTSPTPVPPSFYMLGSGLCCLGFIRRRFFKL